MSSPHFSSYFGFGTFAAEHLGYSQAVRVGDRIELSGQGGWYTDFDPKRHKTFCVSDNIVEQIDQAFKNVDVALKDANGKGWSQVFSVKTYMAPMSKDAMEAVTRNFKQWMPDHKPIWTAVAVARLGDGEDASMKFEIDAVAHDPK